MNELKKCPFCGTDRVHRMSVNCNPADETEKLHYVYCEYCGSHTGVFGSVGLAVDAWNGRAAKNQPLTITELIDKAHANAKAHGWHEPQRSFGELIALCHSELSEALEEYRSGHQVDECYYVCKSCQFGPCELIDEISDGNCTPTPSEKPEGIAIELADVVIRIADMCGLYGIDLEAAIVEKMAYNESRPMRHGGKVL